MFETLQTKLESVFKKLTGRGSVSEKDIQEAMKEVRMALLEADVHYSVVKDFCTKVGEKAIGQDVLQSLSPGQQVIKIVHEELINVLGTGASELNIKVAPPAVIMLVGLQGSGKTTTCAKLAKYLKQELKRTPLLVPADVYRPAAIEQLKTLGQQIGIEVFASEINQDPVQIAKDAYEYASKRAIDTIILDTAGRIQIDQELMKELSEISSAVKPHEILLVVDAMTGQEAVNVAKGFDAALEIDGLILTKLDGDARGGAALSMRAVTGKPIKLIGVGEKSESLEVFHPERMATRILGMGDMVSLIEKAVKDINIEESLELQKKIKKNQFTLGDFLGQLKMIKKMGDMGSIASMIPGMNKMTKNIDPAHMEKEMKRTEAIILSMTLKERENSAVIDGSRRKRIAKGSGTSVEEVNRLLKQFLEMKNMMSKISKMGMGGMMKMMGGAGMGGLANLMRGK
ncbi:MAG: signal recognition particle protein [bacterium]|nr:signal recognition particle protein [bacterium]